jgi:hypothetical protein
MALPAGEQGRIIHAPGLKRFARLRQSNASNNLPSLARAMGGVPPFLIPFHP